MDPADWELQLLQAAMRGRQNLENCATLHLSGSTETKLSVREQARQFEQQALQEQTLRQNRGSQGSLSPILVRDRDSTDNLELTSEVLLSIMDYPYSPSVGRDLPPNIIITQGGDSWPLPSQRPTPPVLRKFSSSISSYMTAQPCQITVEIIPDPPENPPPPPPQQPHPPSPSPSPPSSPSPSPPSPSYLCKPQHTPQPPAPPINKQVAPPPPPPPPLPPPPSPVSDQSRPIVQFVPTSLPPVSSLRPVSERKQRPPPVPSQTDVGKKDLKGILKNIQNLADIERSVANLYSQVDKNCKVPKFNKKPQVTEESEGTNIVQGSDFDDEQSTPKPTNSSSAVQINSTSMNCAENGTSQLNMAAEVQQARQLNSNSPNTAEPSEHFSSQSTMF